MAEQFFQKRRLPEFRHRRQEQNAAANVRFPEAARTPSGIMAGSRPDLEIKIMLEDEDFGSRSLRTHRKRTLWGHQPGSRILPASWPDRQ
ncbi:hypothetical protein [Bosea sp. PAMC 26642]|uniref:hypothetical protein n=1 Tax=Bosea sp. (strain PAMC 26642) TaxID=1792307 RepID=UPI000B018103|nr:hypothetical protein [Bosea sp. PAMC 26642]